MRQPDHHPLDTVLLDYASGSLSEAESLAIATHAALCPACRSRVFDYESVGGALLEAVAPEAVSSDCFASVMARLDKDDADAEDAGSAQTQAGSVAAEPPAAPVDLTLPEPLRGYVGAAPEALPWRRVMPGLEEVEVPLASRRPGARARLLRLRPGMVVPQHSHRGSELTLVLAGGFTDGDDHYERGDFSSSDSAIDHQPVVDPGEPCLCLTVTDAPLRLTGRWTRFLNPFVRW